MKPTRVVLIFKSKILRRYFEELISEIAKNFKYDELGTETMEIYYEQVKRNHTRPAICICPTTKQVGPVLPNLVAKHIRDGSTPYNIFFVDVNK